MEGKAIPVKLTVASAARGSRGELEEAVRLTMPGTLEKRENDWVLRYSETMEDQNDHTSVTHDVYVQVREGHVTVLRRGPYGSMMVFEHGKRYQTNYHTPYGTMEMGIYPTRVQTEVGEEAGRIALEYQLDLQGGFAAVRRMLIEYTGLPEGTAC